MIVNCPNCSLEQPLDPFCAGCGKQLPKLIAEQKIKVKKRNLRSKKIILGSVTAFCFGFYIYYAYQNPDARPFAQSSENSRVKLTMSKGKITASKFQKKEFSKALKVKSFALGAAETPQVEQTPEPVAFKTPKKEKEFKAISVQEVYFVDVDTCTNGEVENGPLSDDELAFFLDCSKVLFKLENGQSSEIDSDLPFTNSTSFEVLGKTVNIVSKLGFEDPAFVVTQSLKLKKTPVRKAGHISSSALNKTMANRINEKLPLAQKELLGSYAASALLGITSDDKPSPKGYFLAVYD